MDSSPTIIIVEDDKGLNHLIQKILRKNGFQTQGVFNGTEAIKQAAGSENVILLLDYELKDMTGKEVIEALEEKKCVVPFIIVTGQGNESIAVEMMKMGAVDYLVKGKGFIDILPHVIGKTVNELAYKIKILESEKELHESEERFRRMTGAITDYTYAVCVEDGKVLETSHSEACIAVTGYSSREFAHDLYLWIEMVFEEDRDIVRHQAEQVLAGQFPHSIEHRIVRKDGAMRWVESTVVPNIDSAGCLVSYDGMVRDITERKRLEEALLEIEEREQRRIGQDLHDDLGQLLTGIAFKSQVLQRKLEKKLTVSTDNIAEITELVNQAKDQARLLSRGLLSLETEEESLMYALKDLTLNTERIYGISCSFICNSIVPIYSKPAVTHLYRIAQEAVTNAVKHGRPSHIDISLSRADDKVELTIKDNGTGKPGILNGSNGMGLQIMHYRSNMIGALLDVRSDTDSGTEIKCSFSDKAKE